MNVVSIPFPYVSEGDYIVKARYRDTTLSGYASAPVKVYAGSATTADFVLTLGSPTTGVIMGFVRDESGLPVKGARVSIDKPYTVTETAQDGGFIFLEVSPGTVHINVVSDGRFGAADVVVQRDTIAKANITIYSQDPARGSLTGVVVADSKPLAGALVSIASIAASDTTDANGSYTLRNIPSGSYELYVSKEGLRTRRFDITVAVGAPTVKNVDVSASLPPFSVEGLELYLPFNGSIDDMSTRKRPMGSKGGSITYAADRFGTAGQAVSFSGTNSVATQEGTLMNYKALTIGAWVYIPSTSNPTHLILGKTMHPLGDGYYVIMDNSMLSFVYTVNGFERYTRINFGNVPKDEWMWIGCSFDSNSNGWATINGTTQSVSNSPFTTVTKSPQEVQFGDLETTTTHPGFSGMMDHVVVYSRYMTIGELKSIMEEKD